MLNRTNVALLLIAAAVLISYQTALAAPPPQGSGSGQDYIVQADDWLSKLADKFYGDPQAYQAIVAATNAKATTDATYIEIENPDVIEVGQRLFVPDSVDAVAEIVDAIDEQPAATVETTPEQPLDAEAVVANETDSLEPTAEQLELLAGLDIKGTPPELNNEVWLNADPMKLADLKGNVVIVEFWTYG